MNVYLTLHRLGYDKESSCGVLFDEAKNVLCFTVEDQPQEVKVQDETRIPTGTYKILKREVLSPMTKRYRETRDWFDWHLELQDVKGFTNIYIHNGEDDDSSSGCVIVGDTLNNNNVTGRYSVRNSKSCFKKVYLYISELLQQGLDVYIVIKDENILHQPF